ncbi:DgyrCDS3554 [Dimorphilus gyrociliatus]|nr:DgyrCDS3554 [Dimorphilus gyrociliatus]
MVANEWEGVRLRVIEAFDEDNQHEEDSLHYEGRAVDLTTSDRDRSKYGMLARLAVLSGFDWVYYESRYHIHCSCKPDSAASLTSFGCFPPTSTVLTASGRQKQIGKLARGDILLTLSSDGHLIETRFLTYLHYNANSTTVYKEIGLEDGWKISLTENHLIYTVEKGAIFARDVTIGDKLFTFNGTRRVVSITFRLINGYSAPLTGDGSLIVDGFWSSCYAEISSHSLAHAAMTPVRLIPALDFYIDIYIRLLTKIATFFLPTSSFFR